MSQAARKKPERKRLPFSIEAVLWVLVGALLIYRLTPQLRAAVGAGSEGAAAPVVDLAMLDGNHLTLDNFKGQVVLVNFWATWCPPCRFEMPGFQKVYAAKHAQGFSIVGLSADEGPREDVVSFLRERNITYPVGMASEENMNAFGGVHAFPTSYLIDKHGRVRYTVRGIFTEIALSQAVDRLLAEP